MLAIATVSLLAVASGCGGCEHSGYESESGPVVVKTPEAQDSEEGRNPAYLEAYEQATNEITIDNARDKLRELNREIDEDSP